jgi:integrase
MATKTVSMANVMLNTLRTMFAWAVGAKHVADNPAADIRCLKPVRANPDDEIGHKTWTENDLARFEAAYPVGTRERLAYSVFLYTGLRASDACGLGRQHVRKDGTIQIRTVKTNTEVFLPILPPLQRALAAGPHGRPGELTFITGPRGHAWGASHLGDWFGGAAEKIGLIKCTAHGLLKAGAKRCAEAGDRQSNDGYLRLGPARYGDSVHLRRKQKAHGAGRRQGPRSRRNRERLFPHPIRRRLCAPISTGLGRS